jgi:hypothetical protein
MKQLLALVLLIGAYLQADESLLKEHITIKIYPYERDGEMRASAMPEFTADSSLLPYKRRFDYLLVNVPTIHSREEAERRGELGKLYPDTTAIREQYLNEYLQDGQLLAYFEESFSYLQDSQLERVNTYDKEELMEVASKFFFCDKVRPDTAIVAHVCIGLNGVKEAQWEKDYTLLEAFCFEAIFDDLEKDQSALWLSFSAGKQQAVEKHRKNISTLDDYLEKVKLELFKQMKADEELEKVLLNYYQKNRENLAFIIV